MAYSLGNLITVGCCGTGYVGCTYWTPRGRFLLRRELNICDNISLDFPFLRECRPPTYTSLKHGLILCLSFFGLSGPSLPFLTRAAVATIHMVWSAEVSKIAEQEPGIDGLWLTILESCLARLWSRGIEQTQRLERSTRPLFRPFQRIRRNSAQKRVIGIAP